MNGEVLKEELDGALADETYEVRYHGNGTAFFLLILKNVLLTVLTFGIYAAWAKTARRKFVWSNLEVHGQRLEYTGTGGELFVGYIKVGLAYLVIFGIPGGLSALSPQVGAVAKIASFVVVMALLPFAIYWSRRYLLSRTRWRGIRLGLTGEAKPYARQFWIGSLLTIVTLGFYAPILGNRLRKIMTDATNLGDQPFHYDGKDGEVFRIALKGFFLTLLTLGIYYPWFAVSLGRYVFEHTRFQGARGRFTLSGADAFMLFMLNAFGTTLTLGIAFPWIATYTIKELCEHIQLKGQIDFDRVMQRASSGNAAADGMADAMGVDLGL